MISAQDTTAIGLLRRDYHCWRRFVAECRRGGVIEKALLLVLGDQPCQIVVGRLSAFEILEPEAQAWLAYFRGIGAIATAPAGEADDVRNKSQTEES